MFSDRTRKIEPFMVMEILEQALDLEKNGIEISHFEIGEPDFDTPRPIIRGCIEGLNKGKTHYTHSLGYIELRNALSEYKLKTRGTKFDPERQLMVTGGTSPAFFNVMSTLIEPGDEVIITTPGYPCYVNFIRFFGGIPVFVPIFEEDEFDLRIDLLEQKVSNKTKLLILNSPSNPTGQIISERTLDKIMDLAIERDFWILSDEIYAELTYSGSIAPSLSQAKFKECHDRLIVLDGFSKLWAMTGWRLGYIIAPINLIQAMTPIQQNFMICAPSISQEAGIHALKCVKETADMLAQYKVRRDLIVSRLNEIDGLRCLHPKGAFYAFCNISSLNLDSMTFCRRLLEEAHVAATPGICFGPNGEGFVRFSYPTNLENIEKGMEKLSAFVRKNF